MTERPTQAHNHTAFFLQSEGYVNVPEAVKQSDAEKVTRYQSEIEALTGAVENFSKFQ
jgi:hypothetical protein